MKARLEYLKDTLGNNYLGINIYYDIVIPYLDQLSKILEDDYDDYVKNQQNRDRGKHHITVINVSDYNRISNEMGMDKFINSLEKYFDAEFDLILMGLGKASKNENTAYFVVVNSEELQEVRKVYGLPEHDFHITLGFKWRDVFGVRKNEILKIENDFLKLLKKEYYNHNETFNFIKNLNHFDGDIEKDIDTISIEETSGIFRSGDNDYYQVGIIDNQLAIIGKWQDKKDKPILSNTLIYRKMKKINY